MIKPKMEMVIMACFLNFTGCAYLDGYTARHDASATPSAVSKGDSGERVSLSDGQAPIFDGTGGAYKEGKQKAVSTFLDFKDIPMPSDTRIDVEHSLVLGNGLNWIGRVVLKNKYDVADMYDFYIQNMPSFGWRPVTTVRGSLTTLVFSAGKDDRVVTIQLVKETFSGTSIEITMAPKGYTS